MREPWKDRRKRLEDVSASLTLPRVGLVPVTDDAATLYETWVGWGGEGIVLKEPTSIYRPGMRSPAWLKVKPTVTLEVVVTGGSLEPIQWGDWGLAVMLEIAYKHPRDGKVIQIRQAIRIRRDEPFTLSAGERAELVCWGVMPSGMLRHPLFVRWLV
jgi:ATP-dependent DNA ligase